VAVDGQFELLFVFSRDVATATNFCWFSSTELTGSRWTQATSGAAGRANVGLLLYLHLVALHIVEGVQEWHSAGSLGSPFPMLKYKYIFQIKHAAAILSKCPRKLLWFETITITNHNGFRVQFDKIAPACFI